MIKKIFVNLRDSCFTVLLKKHGEEYAYKEYRTLFMGILVAYYIPIIIIVGSIQYALGIPNPPIIKSNIFTLFIGGLILFSPLYFTGKYILKKLSTVPLPLVTDVTPENYKKSLKYLAYIFLLGILSPFIVSLILYPP